MSECHLVPCLVRKTTSRPLRQLANMIDCAASLIGTAMPQEHQRRQDMLEPQDERFARDFLQFSHFVAPKSMFSHFFCLNVKIYHFKTDVSCAASVNLHHMSEHGMSKVLHLPRKQNDRGLESVARATNCATHLLQRTAKYCAYH